MKNSNINHDVI